jgi:prepilin-type N-terminal cleavage/methylation domain-containing protein
MKRRGFTLIELMVVIAIIIILAAIAIPNYLKMTERAKKSRVASDFAAIATALETYRTDWGVYPTQSYDALKSGVANSCYNQLTGSDVSGATALNSVDHTTAAGDKGPIIYMTTNILDSMKNPYNSANTYKYGSANGTHWILSACDTTGSEANGPWLVRSDTTTSLAEVSTAPTAP